MIGPAAESPVLETAALTRRFGSIVAVHHLDLVVAQRAIFGLLGPNGAGKSTLMKIIAGAYIPDSGTIYLSGEKVSFSHPQEAQLKGISIIYQEFNLLPERTVAHNIFLGREPSRFGAMDLRQMNKKAREVLKEEGI